MIKTICFDHGGVITNDFGKELLDFASKRLGIENTELRKLMDKYEPNLQLGKFDHVEFWRKILKEKGRQQLPDSKLKDIWLTPYIRFSKVDPKMISLVKKLKKNYIVGLISNTQEPHVSINRKKTYPYFDPILLSNEIGLRKPDPQIFKLYLKKTKCKAEEMIFIDDIEKNLVNAREMGINVILFKNYEQLVEALKKLGVNL